MRLIHLVIDSDELKKDPFYVYPLRRSEVGKPMQIRVATTDEWWRNAVKVMAFFDTDECKEYTPQIIRDGVCEVPAECLNGLSFKVQILGKKDGEVAKTNILPLIQIGG